MHLLVTQWLITDSNTFSLLFKDISVREVRSIFLISAPIENSPSPHSLFSSTSHFFHPVVSCQRLEGGFLQQFWVIPRTNTRWRTETALVTANRSPSSLPLYQSETRTGCILLEGCGRQGMWRVTLRTGAGNLNRSLVKSGETKTSLYQIWEHVFVLILAGTKSLKCSNFNYGHNMSSRDTKE